MVRHSCLSFRVLINIIVNRHHGVGGGGCLLDIQSTMGRDYIIMNSDRALVKLHCCSSPYG